MRGASHAKLAERIEALSRYGHVLTEHMASSKTIDRGDDAAIHTHDQALLARADVFIADVSQPSTGTGYMLARAVAFGMPVLALYERGQSPSAMIAGSPDITTSFFDDDFMAPVRAFLVAHRQQTSAPKIFLAGPPGSGKGTCGARLAALLGAPHISTGDLLRELVRTRADEPRTIEIQRHMSAGELVPAEMMRDLVNARLAAPDCRALGFILDGYPPSREDLANLAVIPDIVFDFACSDATSIARQVGRNARSTDTPERAAQRVRVYREEMAGFAAWYPGAIVARVDAERSANAAFEMVAETVQNSFRGALHPRSYYPVPGEPRSTRLHLHVDAQNEQVVRAIARAVTVLHRPAQGQLKIYPIRSLALGTQQGRLPIYKQLPNFHAFADRTDEAFITGRLGDGDRALMQAVLDVTRAYGGMAELEEYVGEWTLRADGSLHTDAEYALLDADHTYPDHAAHLCNEIPVWELHHGFDLPAPIDLHELVSRCGAGGLDNGGWFIFANDRHWAYRSNEFANGTLEAARERLFAQAKMLQTIVPADIGFSLERVHAIWTY